MPVAVGQGLPLFGRLDAPADLVLTWSKVYSSGSLGLRYATHDRPDAVVRSRYVRDRSEES
jgi:hypothetical protein